MSTDEKKKRKSKYRHVSEVIGGLDEHVAMLIVARSLEVVQDHTARMQELLDELKRGLRGEAKEEEKS